MHNCMTSTCAFSDVTFLLGDKKPFRSKHINYGRLSVLKYQQTRCHSVPDVSPAVRNRHSCTVNVDLLKCLSLCLSPLPRPAVQQLPQQDLPGAERPHDQQNPSEVGRGRRRRGHVRVQGEEAAMMMMQLIHSFLVMTVCLSEARQF